MPASNKQKSGGASLRGLLALPNEHPLKTLAVALVLCLVCSTLVSATAILLKPLQLANEELLARQREILRAVGRFESEDKISRAFRQVDARLVDLATGEYVTDIDFDDYHYGRAAADPATRMEIDPQEDIARLNAIARIAPVYLFQDHGVTTYIVIPVRGYGLWSTMHAYLALHADGNRIAGISFYQHGETPGLGGEITNPRWQAQWEDKHIYDAQGQVRLKLVKNADSNKGDGQFQIDALSGATLTSIGVTNLIRFWLGDQGYGPYLKRNFRTEAQGVS